jgi:outer membrane autotransporter protein
VKGDFLSLTSALHSVPATIASQGDVVGAQAEAGYRFTIGAAYLEPVARLRAGRIQLDDLTGANGVAHFDAVSRLQGQAGARFGAAWSQVLDTTVSVGVYAVSDLTGRAEETFATGPSGVSLSDVLTRTHGMVDFGLTMKSHGGVQGFLKASADFAGGLGGWTAGGGVRWAF